MKKLIFSIFISLFFYLIFKQNVYAACVITTVDSTNPNTKINITTTDIPDWGNGYCPAFVIYDANNNEIGCFFLTNSTNTRQITTPSSGNSIKIQIENRPIDQSTAIGNQSCFGKSGNQNYCSKTIYLTGVDVGDKNKTPSCKASLNQATTDQIIINFENAANLGYVFYINGPPKNKDYHSGSITSNNKSVQVGEGWEAGSYKIEIRESETASGKGELLASCSFYYNGISSLDRLNNPELNEKLNESICQGNEKCEECVKGNNAWTVFGCLLTSNSESFVNQLLTIVLGIAGGIAFLFMIFGVLQIILSAGNPDRVKAGKEIIVAALGGLFLILFSVLILRIIGVDILGIEGFK